MTLDAAKGRRKPRSTASSRHRVIDVTPGKPRPCTVTSDRGTFVRDRHRGDVSRAVEAGMNAAFWSPMIAKMSAVAAAADFDLLDAELARWLRARVALRAMCDRDDSPLDEVATALRKLRATLSLTVSNATADDTTTDAVAVRTYRWSIRMARELDAIEELGLDALGEWTRFEAFAPFALAFFHSLLGPVLTDAASDMAVSRLRRDIDVALSPFLIAMTSSAMAA